MYDISTECAYIKSPNVVYSASRKSCSEIEVLGPTTSRSWTTALGAISRNVTAIGGATVSIVNTDKPTQVLRISLVKHHGEAVDGKCKMLSGC